MFVNSNTLSELKSYFYNKLELHFSMSEMKFMFYSTLEIRLNIPMEQLWFRDEMRLSESDLLFVRTIAHKLLENHPFQYLIGKTEFYDIQIKCDSRALIPRPETEELVDLIQTQFPSKSEKLHFFDFCTGSACIALALKNIFKNASVQASDVSAEALELANENAKLNKLEVDFILHDLLREEIIFLENESLDCIVSNPPYIPESEKLQMSENVLNFEPHLALFVSNENPLIFYKKIAEIAQSKLKKGGKLFFELNENYANETAKLLLEMNFQSIEIIKDLQGKERMLKAIK